MNSSSSGRRLEGFLSGKGFYIVLFLCAAVIGVSAWMTAAGNGTMSEDALQTSASESEERRVETVIIPARPNREGLALPDSDTDAPAIVEEAPAAPTPAISEERRAVNATATEFLWPVSGEIDRGHSGDRLSYDPTMRDWRSHSGIDILAELGAPVQAACAGTVESLRRDDMLGTVIVLSHADGSRTVYANLDENAAVTEGQWVEAGQVIGAVGRSALGEIGQPSHLHFALQVNGRYADPLAYLAG